MEYIREQMLKLEDPNFFKKSMVELANVELYLQPIYNEVLKHRLKTQNLRSAVAEHYIPMMIDFKENLEERKCSVSQKTLNVKDLLQRLDDALFEKIPPSGKCE